LSKPCIILIGIIASNHPSSDKFFNKSNDSLLARFFLNGFAALTGPTGLLYVSENLLGGYMQLTAMMVNIIYSAIGGFLTLFFMYIGYKVFDKVTHFDTSEELAKDNRAVGMVVLGIFVGVGIAIGLVIGLGLN